MVRKNPLFLLADSNALAFVCVENHETHTQYEDALITKTCLFTLVNSYFSLFYIGTVRVFCALVWFPPSALRECAPVRSVLEESHHAVWASPGMRCRTLWKA